MGQYSAEFLNMFTDLANAVWRVPQELINATIPKKGNVHCCDNWRGIALLDDDVMGKFVARIVQG